MTGDGRCYFYAVVKALGWALNGNRESPEGLKKLLTQNPTLFNKPGQKLKQDGGVFKNIQDYWMKQVVEGAYRDPANVLIQSSNMVSVLYDLGMRYVMKVARPSSKDFGGLDDLLLRQQDVPSLIIYEIKKRRVQKKDDGRAPYVLERVRPGEKKKRAAALRSITERKAVVFVWMQTIRHWHVALPTQVVEV